MKGLMYALLVLGLVGLTSSVRCYECEYTSTNGLSNSCEAPDETTPKASCEGECRKVYTEGGGVVSITRSCEAPFCYDHKCLEKDGARICTTCCIRDLCNSACSVTFNLVAMFGLIATAWGLSK
ncbi:U-scoloptoxin(05)-Cw1a-like [Asterias amurensis]|uniref:U-scoloptoxin(05)-Cw1a-like n=1 Tax=Asterias amurensis TaxID=7602 RepID=UPI003AB5E4D8